MLEDSRRTTRERILAFTRRFNRQPKSIDEVDRIIKDTDDAAANNTRPNTYAAAAAAPSSSTATPSDPRTADSSAHVSAPSSASTASSASFLLRPPKHRRHSGVMAVSREFKLPDLPWLCGTWHVTHSTLPMWRNKRNVRIVYTRIPGNRLDDLVTYQSRTSPEVKKVHGVDKPRKDGTYTWRGKGLLRVASSKWEVLGWGGGGADPNAEQWIVTYFARTGFTPAGIDIYSRKQEGLTPRTLQKLREALDRLDQGPKGGPQTEFGRLIASLQEVMIDDARGDVRVD